jgi:hypothetical protein
LPLLTPPAIAPLILLLVAATTTPLLLLKAASAAALHSRHRHAAGQSAEKILHFGAADESFAPAANGESLGRIGQPHAGKPALTGRAAATEIALQAAHTCAGRTVAEHAARPAAP